MRAAFVPKYPQLLPLDYHSSKRISQLTIIQAPLGDVLISCVKVIKIIHCRISTPAQYSMF